MFFVFPLQRTVVVRRTPDVRRAALVTMLMTRLYSFRVSSGWVEKLSSVLVRVTLGVRHVLSLRRPILSSSFSFGSSVSRWPVEWSAELASHGFCIIPVLLTPDEIGKLSAELSAVQSNDSVRRRKGVYAIRNLLDIVPAVAELAASERLKALVAAALAPNAFAVRATLFDKTPGANWLVPWHQDLTVSVKERLEITGYGPWTVKAGVHHVQPPVSILEGMLAVRIHLDDCHEQNGALRVLAGTHHAGRLTAEQIELARRSATPITCSVNRGGAVLIKPLLLHASSAANQPSHRRVIHIDFASSDLAGGLKWFTE